MSDSVLLLRLIVVLLGAWLLFDIAMFIMDFLEEKKGKKENEKLN